MKNKIADNLEEIFEEIENLTYGTLLNTTVLDLKNYVIQLRDNYGKLKENNNVLINELKDNIIEAERQIDDWIDTGLKDLIESNKRVIKQAEEL